MNGGAETRREQRVMTVPRCHERQGAVPSPCVGEEPRETATHASPAGAHGDLDLKAAVTRWRQDVGLKLAPRPQALSGSLCSLHSSPGGGAQFGERPGLVHVCRAARVASSAFSVGGSERMWDSE